MSFTYLRFRAHLALVALIVCAAPLAAAPRFQIEERALRPLRESKSPGARVQLNAIPIDGAPQTLDLEQFDIYAPGAVIEAVGPDGRIRQIPKPSIRYFRGSIVGDDDSLVFLAVDKSVGGFISSGHRKFRILSEPRSRPRVYRGRGTDVDVFVQEVPVSEEIGWNGEPWTCAVDDFPMRPGTSLEAAVGSTSLGDVAAQSLTSPTATYVFNMAVEGDYELFQRQGANPANTAAYLSSVTAASSVIYKRDLQTELRIAYQIHHENPSDPFTIVPEADNNPSTLDALVEFGARWHNSPPFLGARSAAMFVSGKAVPSGIAWLQTVCTGDFPYPTPNVSGGYGGAYGLLMDAGNATNFDPDGNPEYAAATTTFDNSYWPVLAFAHELGHVIQSTHTHCIELTDPEKTTYGRNYVDQCYSGEGGCYDDGTTPAHATGQVPTEKGTVMSYCHLNGGRGMDTRFTFGKASEASHHVLDQMKALIDSRTPTISSSISAPSSLTIGVAASASVNLGPNLSYQWEITNGVANSGGTGSTGGAGGTASLNFTATANPVVLRIFATNGSGCSATDLLAISALASGGGVRGDSNGDGNADIFWRHSSGLNAWWFMNGASLSSSAFTSSLDSTWSVGGAGDFDGNGTTDLTWRHSSGLNAVWLMDGETITSSAFVPSLDADWELVTVADFDGDGKSDMFWRHATGGLNAIWFMNGASIGSSAYTSSLDSTWTLLAAGDFGGDGKADLVWKHASGLIAAWNMSGVAIDSSAFLPTLDSTWSLIATGDFDGNGNADILWRHDSGLNAMWFMNGAAVSSSAYTTELPLSWNLLASGDYDGNGKADLFWRLHSGETAVWLMDGHVISSAAFTPSLDTTWNTRPDPATSAGE